MLKMHLIDLPRSLKRMLSLCSDGCVVFLAVWIACSLRLDTLHIPQGGQWWAYGLAPLLALPVFIYFGLYRTIFRYAGFATIWVVAKAVAVYGLLYASILLIFHISGVPRSVGVIQPLLVLLFVCGTRAWVRTWLGGRSATELAIKRSPDASLPRVLIYGAGSAGRQLMAAINNSHEMVVCGFIDDDNQLYGHSINGVTVYPPKNIQELIERHDITDVLLALPSASRARRNEILNTLRLNRVHIRTLPGLMDIANGRIQSSDLRELDIEDLLGREPVPPDPVLLERNIAKKVLLVTGAGGSIGSELCRQILCIGPVVLILVDHNEYGLYAIHQELEKKLVEDHASSDMKIVPLLASVRDYQRMASIMAEWRPHTVYHAAAYKHVPLVESNPAEGIRNNVLGTLTAARAAMETGVVDFVLVSTDKAVRPTNVMGASKRLAELVLQALAQAKSVMFEKNDAQQSVTNRTRFSMVRFGNVLGSSGSVVPLFRQQIREGGPITLTHAEVTRFFMTIPEAAQLVIQAGAMATGGDVFVLDMGQPVKIIDLARRIVELSGLTVKDDEHPQGDIEIKVTGLRPGEKLYEELLIGDNPKHTSHPRIMKAHEEFFHWDILSERLDSLQEILDDCNGRNTNALTVLLEELVAGYKPTKENIKEIVCAANT